MGSLIRCPSHETPVARRPQHPRVGLPFDTRSVHNEGFEMTTDTHIEGSLMWQVRSDQVERTQEEAFLYCRQLRLAGHQDWRLPSLAEFRSLRSRLEPPHGDFWTSTDEPKLSSRVAYIDDGTTMFRTNKYFVRAVRAL